MLESIDRQAAGTREQVRKRIRDHPSNVSNGCCSVLGYATASTKIRSSGRRQQMDDVEIIVRRRKGVDERKALKLLSKFLKRDQEKDADDRVSNGRYRMWTGVLQERYAFTLQRPSHET